MPLFGKPSPYSKTVALVIGVKQFPGLAPAEQLRFATMDAVHFGDFIKTSGTGTPDVTVLTDSDATRANVVAALDHLSKVVDHSTLVVVYYSGHAMSGPSGGAELLMWNSDGKNDRLNVSTSEIKSFLNGLDAKAKCFFIDASLNSIDNPSNSPS
jgi:hypothetical protein